MSNITINQLPTANSIDASLDYLPIYTASASATQAINRNTLLGLSSAPVGLTDTQTLTNKTLTSPTISGPTLSGTISGTYTIGGTPTFPSSVATLTGSQTLTNKTLTSPTINSPTITNATITADALSGYTTSNSGTIYGISISSGAISSNLSATGTLAVTGATTLSSTLAVTGAVTLSTSLTVNGGTVSIMPYLKNPYKFSVYRNASLSQSSSAQLLTFDAEIFDTGSNYSTSTGKFTAPIAGFYIFGGQVSLQAPTVTTNYVSIYINGIEKYRVALFNAYSGTVTNVIPIPDIPISLSAGDYIQIYTNFQSTATVNVGSAPYNTFFSGYLKSAT